MKCNHKIWDMDAATADGLCPLCQQIRINQLRGALSEAREWLLSVENNILSNTSTTLKPTLTKIDAVLANGQNAGAKDG